MIQQYSSKQIESNINICFGQNVLEKKTPVEIKLSFDIFSQKSQSIRFNLQELLNEVIQENTLVIELTSRTGYGSELRHKILQFIKTNKNYLKLNSQNKLFIKCVDKSQKCYIFIQSNKLQEVFQKIGQICSQLQSEKKDNHKQNNFIKLSIKSSNSCQQIRKLLDNQGGMRAAFDSLCINLKFHKTQAVAKFIQLLAKQIQIPQVIGPLKAFKNLNLNVNFASSQEFDKYQKMRVFAKIFQKIQTNLFSSVKGQYQDQIKINYFNKNISLNGIIYGQNIESLIDALFGQPSKQE